MNYCSLKGEFLCEMSVDEICFMENPCYRCPYCVDKEVKVDE